MTQVWTGGVPHKNPHAASRNFGGEAFIVIPQRHQYKILNGTGSRVWELIDGSRDAEEIARMIAEEYDVTIEAARKDVTSFLGDLSEHGMLADVPSAKGA
ncbi:MAG TPA: PqqD family protein [Candidatus Polarisedimenticolia bacterium]|nr:PqqD family protein [Candidatus Polarisedimenticolia bacterium]